MSINVMGGPQVPWPTDLSYEELVKKCPFLSRNESLDLNNKQIISNEIGNPAVPISKSKKKRLKKRLKAINQEKLELHEAHHLADPHFHLTNQPHKELRSIMSSPSKVINKKQVSKVSNEVKAQKSNRTSDMVDGEMLVRGTPEVFAKSREEVLAERDAMKKQKKLSKHQKKDSTEPRSPNNRMESQSKNQSVDIGSSIGNSVGKSCLEVSSEKKDALETASKVAKPNLAPVVSCVENGEKSRDAVKAEREAKKKAKLLAKQKKKDPCAEAPAGLGGGTTGQAKSDAGRELVEVRTPEVQEVAAAPLKTKAELKAERRIKQEAQRAAKEADKSKKKYSPENKENTPVIEKKKVQKTSEDKRPELLTEARKRSASKSVVSQRIKLFSHLRLARKPSQTQILPNIHPAILDLGAKYSARIINGSNARCIALLKCLKEVIEDYTTPTEKEFSRGLESKLGELTNYLNLCRPMSVSMTNALRHIKSHLTQLPNNISDEDARRKLCDVIDTFIREQIDVAGEAICVSVKKKITTGDVILIYSCSSLLSRILIESARSGVDFSVVVVDGGPWYEGREMLRRLVTAGLSCTYVQISALSFIMRQATKVLLGAHALLANGSVMSRAGSSLVALMASVYNVPVLVCCETYKFCERVQTDVFVYNELGSPDDLSKEDSRLANWECLPSLSPLSLVYDITPPDLVTAVVTEIAVLPCTSVPVILRVKPSDLVS